MKLILLLFTTIISITSSAQSDSTFSDLKGFEDKNGNVFLYYRINESHNDGDMHYKSFNIYSYDSNKKTSYIKFFASQSYFGSGEVHFFPSSNDIYDFEYWARDTSKLFFSYVGCGIDCSGGVIKKFDDLIDEIAFIMNSSSFIEVSKQDSNFIVLHGNHSALISETGRFIHVGNETSFIETDFNVVSIFPQNDSLMLSTLNENETLSLYKSVNRGKTFSPISTTIKWDIQNANKPFQFSSDGSTIYSLLNNYPIYRLVVSKDFGESWTIAYSDSALFYFSMDEYQPEQVFISKGKDILKSEDYGKTFQHFNSLTQNVVGLYKKPKENIVYAITPNFLSEISTSSINNLNRFYTEISSNPLQSKSFVLFQNYPNPFNPETLISFSVPKPSQVKITIFDILGRQIEVITNQFYATGTHQFIFNGENYSNGTYICTLESGSFKQSNKMVLLK